MAFSQLPHAPKQVCLFLALLVCFSAIRCAESKRASTGMNCDSPTLSLYDDSPSCEGNPDSGPFFDPGVCSGNCSSIPNGDYTMQYKCSATGGLIVQRSFGPGCQGPFSNMFVETSRCTRFMGGTTSYTLTCDANDPILPPITTDPPSWGNGTFIPALGSCEMPFQCPPRMPFATYFSRPNCAGSSESSTFSQNALLDGCYLLPWPIGFNLKMTCNQGLVFNLHSTCDTPPFATVSYPTSVCINDDDGFSSTMYNCGTTGSFESSKTSQLHDSTASQQPETIANTLNRIFAHTSAKHSPLFKRMMLRTRP